MPKTGGCTQRAHTYYAKYASGLRNTFEFTFKYARAASKDGHIWGGIAATVQQSCAITYVCSAFQRRPKGAGTLSTKVCEIYKYI